MNDTERPEPIAKDEGLLVRTRNRARALLERATASPTEEGHRRKVLLILGLGILAIIIALSILSRLNGDDAAHTPIATAQAVSAINVETSQFAPHALNSEARPVRDIQVAAPASGFILEILVDEGQFVRQGQPMARLDTSLAQAQIQTAQASVAEAGSAAVRARNMNARIRSAIRRTLHRGDRRPPRRHDGGASAAAARGALQEVNAGRLRARPAAGLVIDRTAEVGAT